MKKFTRLFFSMKFALILLGILVAACVAGSVIPQGEAASYYMSAYSEKRGAAILALGLDDVFHCGWFIVLTVILCLNLIGCNIVRFPSLLRRTREGFTPEKYLKSGSRPEICRSDDPEELLRENCEWAYMSTRDRIGYLETHANLEGRTRRRYRYDVWAQAVAPFACLVITLFAIPMGIATGRQSVSKGIIGALSMFFAFYGLSILCMVLAARGWLAPFPAAVLPDLVFLALGVYLFWRNR